jgi:hypothetical protein
MMEAGIEKQRQNDGGRDRMMEAGLDAEQLSARWMRKWMQGQMQLSAAI